MQQLNNISSVF